MPTLPPPASDSEVVLDEVALNLSVPTAVKDLLTDVQYERKKARHPNTTYRELVIEAIEQTFGVREKGKRSVRQ